MATLQITMIRPADDLGSVLTSRAVAEQLRMRIEEATEGGNRVVVDFEGVEAISPSFADEVFAKIDAELVGSGQVSFENLSDDLRVLARFVVAGRESHG